MGIFKPQPPRLQRGHPLARGLVGAWEFTEGSGLTAYDSSGYGNHGTLAGASLPVWAGGPSGPALSFEGSSAFVSTSLAPGTAFNNGISVAALVSLSTGSGTFPEFFGSTFGVLIGGVGAASNKMDFYVRNGGAWTHTSNSNTMSQNANHLVVGTHDGATARIYVDGAQQSTGSGAANLTATNVFSIGGAHNGNNFWDGLISFVRLYNRALSAAEVALLYQMTGP